MVTRIECRPKRILPIIARKGKQGKISGFDGIATPQSIFGLDSQIDLTDIGSH
jgi:hypothetical protein